MRHSGSNWCAERVGEVAAGLVKLEALTVGHLTFQITPIASPHRAGTVLGALGSEDFVAGSETA